MALDSNFDIFEDLFGSDEEPLAVNSDFSSNTSPNSSDSGCGGSPQSYLSSLNSPEKGIQWEDEFWGSILDNIPDSELTDNNDHASALNVSLPPDKIFNESLEWKSDDVHFSDVSLTNESNLFSQDNDLVENDWRNEMETEQVQLTTANTTAQFTTPVAVMSSIANHKPNVSNQTTPVSNSSIILKPMTMMKDNDINTNQNSQTVSHFKIGKNIFAIIKSNNIKTTNSVTKPLETNPVVTQKVIPTTNENLLQDHDYADDDYIDVCGTTGVSKGVGPNLVLTDEEKKLLEIESVTIPEGVTLTKDEEKVLKKVRRKIKNKQSAMESRRRRKEYIENLEKRVKHCTDMNSGLKKKVDILSHENKSLLQQLKQLQSLVATSVQQSRTAQTGTCLAVVLLSFALFFLPFNPMNSKTDGNIASTEAPKNMFRSRVLLSTNDTLDYDYHENEIENANIFMGSSAIDHNNNSFVFGDDVRESIEKLLHSEDSEVLRSKLENIMIANVYNKAKDAPYYGDTIDGGAINFIEIEQNTVQSRRHKQKILEDEK